MNKTLFYQGPVFAKKSAIAGIAHMIQLTPIPPQRQSCQSRMRHNGCTSGTFFRTARTILKDRRQLCLNGGRGDRTAMPTLGHGTFFCKHRSKIYYASCIPHPPVRSFYKKLMSPRCTADGKVGSVLSGLTAFWKECRWQPHANASSRLFLPTPKHPWSRSAALAEFQIQSWASDQRGTRLTHR